MGYSLWTHRIRLDLVTKHHKLMLTLKNLDSTDNQKKKFKTCYSMAQISPLIIFSFIFTLSTNLFLCKLYKSRFTLISLFCNLIFLAVYHDQGPFTVFFNIYLNGCMLVHYIPTP